MYMLNCLRMWNHEIQYDKTQYKKNRQCIYNEKNYTNEWKRKRMIILYEV